MSDQNNFTSDEIRAMPVVDGPSYLAPASDDVLMSDTVQYWLDPITGDIYNIEQQNGRWVRYKSGVVNKGIADPKRQRTTRFVDFLPGDHCDAKLYVLQMAEIMHPGDEIFFNGFQLSRVFPVGWPSIYDSLESAVLSCLIGSAWGRYKIDADYWAKGRTWFKLSCHEPGDKRVYADPDRRHLYERMPDGELIPNAVPFYEHVKSYRAEIAQ